MSGPAFCLSSTRAIAAALVLQLIPLLSFAAQAPAVPRDFSVRLVSSSLAARAPGRPADEEWVEVKASGETALSAMEAPNGRLPATTIRLPADRVAMIYQQILASRFFELNPSYEDARVQDGDAAEMIVTAGGRTHRVRTKNIKVGAFDRITLVIDATLPPERRIQYNALHVPAYRSVER